MPWALADGAFLLRALALKDGDFEEAAESLTAGLEKNGTLENWQHV